MFSSGLRESKEEKIEMHDVKFPVLQEVINFFYTSEIKITEDNVYGIMGIAELLQVSAIQTICSHYLYSTLSNTNCLSVYINASLYNDHSLAQKAFKYILKQFKYVMKEEEFIHTPSEVLLKIFNSQLINISNEGELLKGLIKWCNHNWNENIEELWSLLSKIHLHLVPMETLVDLKKDPFIIKTNLLSQIEDTITCNLSLKFDNRNETKMSDMHLKFNWKPRYSDEREVILAIGGGYSSKSYSSCVATRIVECFTPGYMSWNCSVPTIIDEGQCNGIRIISAMMQKRMNFGVAAKDYEVFIIGGCNSTDVLDAVEYYSIQSNEWSELTPLPVAVQGAGAVFLKQLHVIGGRGVYNYKKKIWVYEENRNSWSDKISPMNKHRAFHGVVTVYGDIYALGGIGGEEPGMEEYLQCVEKFDRYRNEWHLVAPMQQKRSMFGCAAINEFIYVMGGYDGVVQLNSVERFNTLTNEWCYMMPMNDPRSNFATTICGNNICCIGGYACYDCNKVERYNPHTDRWYSIDPISVSKFGIGAATLHIPMFRDS